MRPPDTNPLRLGLPAGFIAGLVVGLLLGWAFHGVVGLLIRLGIVALLLIPLAIVVWFFFLRSRLARGEGGQGAVQIYTWRGGQGTPPATATTSRPPPPRADDAIDVEFEELKRQVEDEGTPR